MDAGDSEAEGKKARGHDRGAPNYSRGAPRSAGNRREPAAGRKAMVKAWVWVVRAGIARMSESIVIPSSAW